MVMFQQDNLTIFAIILNEDGEFKKTLGNYLQLPAHSHIYRFCSYRFGFGLVIETVLRLVGNRTS